MWLCGFVKYDNRLVFVLINYVLTIIEHSVDVNIDTIQSHVNILYANSILSLPSGPSPMSCHLMTRSQRDKRALVSLSTLAQVQLLGEHMQGQPQWHPGTWVSNDSSQLVCYIISKFNI